MKALKAAAATPAGKVTVNAATGAGTTIAVWGANAYALAPNAMELIPTEIGMAISTCLMATVQWRQSR
jgi:hypothetical protein